MPSLVTKVSKHHLLFATLFTCFLLILSFSSSERIDGVSEELSAAVKMAIQRFRNTSLYYRLSLHLQKYGLYDFQAAYAVVLIEEDLVQLDIGLEGWPEKALVGPKSRTQGIAQKDAKISGKVNRSFSWRRVIVIHEEDTQSADSRAVDLLCDSLQNAGLDMEYRLVFPKRFTHQRVDMLQTIFSGVFIILPSRLPLANLSWLHNSPWSPARSHTFLISCKEGFSESKAHYAIQNKCFQQFFKLFQQTFQLVFPEENISETGSYAIQAYDSIITLLWTMEQIVDNHISSRIFQDSVLERDLIDLSREAGFKKDFHPTVESLPIIQNFTRTVDFSSALFRESGLSLVIPLKPESTRTWMFFKPFTRGMWLATVAVLIYTMFIVWFIEHQCNPDFGSMWTEQLGNTFCSLFIVQRESHRSYYTRMVVLMWFFVVLVVTQSYISVFTSMITTSASQPMVRDIEQLKETTATIGFIGGSTVRNYLEKVLKFDADNIKSISNSFDLLVEFESSNIAAGFLTISNAKTFVEQRDKKYTIASTYRFGGPDFVSCECSNSQTTSGSSGVNLSLQNFQDLYIVYSSASAFCLLLFLLQLLVKNWQLISASTRVRNVVIWLLAHLKTVWNKAVKFIHHLVQGVWNRAVMLWCYRQSQDNVSQRRAPTYTHAQHEVELSCTASA